MLHTQNSPQQFQVAGFVLKTFDILNNEEFSKIIFWGSSGKDFVIKDHNKFQEIILPRYFRHGNINSFIRQLNMYGFHKSRKDNSKSIFSHPNFLKGREDLLSTIKRKIKQANPSLETPSKKNSGDQSKKQIETAVKQSEPSQIIIPEVSRVCLNTFLESRQNLDSRFYLNHSLHKISFDDFECLEKQEKQQDQLSIENGIEQFNERIQEIGSLKKLINPSLFFNSFIDRNQKQDKNQPHQKQASENNKKKKIRVNNNLIDI